MRYEYAVIAVGDFSKMHRDKILSVLVREKVSSIVAAGSGRQSGGGGLHRLSQTSNKNVIRVFRKRDDPKTIVRSLVHQIIIHFTQY
jgi:hypothetical protein